MNQPGRNVTPQVATGSATAATVQRSAEEMLATHPGLPPAPQPEVQPGQHSDVTVQHNVTAEQLAQPPEMPSEPADNTLGVPQLMTRLHQGHKDLERYEASYMSLVKQLRSLGAAQDLQDRPLIVFWNTADRDHEMIECCFDYGWIADDERRELLTTMANAIARRITVEIEGIHRISGLISAKQQMAAAQAQQAPH